MSATSTPRKLADYPAEQIRSAIDLLEHHCKAAIVAGTEELSTEKGRNDLAFAAGKHRVLLDLQNAHREACKRITTPIPGGVRSG